MLPFTGNVTVYDSERRVLTLRYQSFVRKVFLVLPCGVLRVLSRLIGCQTPCRVILTVGEPSINLESPSGRDEPRSP